MRNSTEVTVFASTLIPASAEANPLENKLLSNIVLEPFVAYTHNAEPVTFLIQAPTASPVSFVCAKIDAEAAYLGKNYITISLKTFLHLLVKRVVDGI
jgi:hypothetical protein